MQLRNSIIDINTIDYIIKYDDYDLNVNNRSEITLICFLFLL